MGLSFLFRVRYLLAFEAKLCSAVRPIFMHTLPGWLRERGESAGILAVRSDAVVVAQRFGSALKLRIIEQHDDIEPIVVVVTNAS